MGHRTPEGILWDLAVKDERGKLDFDDMDVYVEEISNLSPDAFSRKAKRTYTCPSCGSNEDIQLSVEIIPESEDDPRGEVHSIWVDSACTRCGDWCCIDVTSEMGDFFAYWSEDREEG